jgi:cytochrome c oxidase assembly factor CtaG
MRTFLSGLRWAVVFAVVGIVLCVLVFAVDFELRARRHPNADLQPGSAWLLGVIFGGFAFGPPVGALGAVVGLVVGVIRASRRRYTYAAQAPPDEIVP